MKVVVKKIVSVNDLNDLRNRNDIGELYLILGNDLNMEGEFEPLNLENTLVYINGNNHVIDGLNINKQNDKYVGLLSKVKNLTITNIGICNSNIIGEEICGIVAGKVEKKLHIENAEIKGNVQSDAIAGGICGSAGCVDIVNTYVDANIKGRGVLGGICGMANELDIDEESMIDVNIDSKYAKTIKDAAIDPYVGYLSSDRKEYIEKYIINELLNDKKLILESVKKSV